MFRGGEVVELQGMTSDGLLSFRLPRVTLALTTQFYDGGSVAEHRARLHTVILCPDRKSFVLVWHSHLPCHHKVNKLKSTEVTLKKRVNVPRIELESGTWLGV